MEKFEIFTDSTGVYRWRLRDPGGETVTTSEGYLSKLGCEHAISAIKKYAQTAEVADLTLPSTH